jgi:hypothetical protein
MKRGNLHCCTSGSECCVGDGTEAGGKTHDNRRAAFLQGRMSKRDGTELQSNCSQNGKFGRTEHVGLHGDEPRSVKSEFEVRVQTRKQAKKKAWIIVKFLMDSKARCQHLRNCVKNVDDGLRIS